MFMGLSTFKIPSRCTLRRHASPWRQSAAVLLVATGALGGCSSEGPELGTVGHVQGFLGGVAADEPRAVLVARDVLSAGGTATDAAVALYFALSVTLPSAASLGGGGTCVVFDQKSGRVEALDFMAPAGRRAGRPGAVPRNPRGMFALHAKYGRLRWAQLVAPAEKLARFGSPVSRALASHLAAAGGSLLADREGRRVFAGSDGGPVREGDIIEQLDLSVVLSILRREPGQFYSGPFARQLVKAVGQAGGSLTIEELRSFTPQWKETLAVEFGNLTAHFAPTPAGLTAAQMWAALTQNRRYRREDEDARPHLFAEVAMRAFADRGRWFGPLGGALAPLGDRVSSRGVRELMAGYRSDRHTPARTLRAAPVQRPENHTAASFVVADRDRQAVSCVFTLNNLFGAGRIAPGTGMVLPAAPPHGGLGASALASMLVINQNLYQLFFVAAASGGAAAPTAMVHVALRVLVEKLTLEAAMSSRRLHHGGAPDQVFHERGESPEKLAALARRGHRTVETPALGQVNAFSCPRGLESEESLCQVKADPRGFGLDQQE